MQDNINQFYQRLFELSRNKPQKDAYLPYVDGKLLILQNPQSICHVLGKNIANYPKKYDWFRQCIGISRFTENSPKWQSLKSITQPFLNGFDREKLADIIKQIIPEYLDRLTSPDLNAETQTLEEPLLREMAIDIFCRTFFDMKVSDLSLNFEDITELLSIALQHAFITEGGVPGKIQKDVYKRIFALRKEMLKGFKALRDPRFHHSQLMKTIFQADQEGILIFEHELMFIFSIGIETTVHSLGWLLFTLAQYPQIQNQIRDDILYLRPSDKGPFSEITMATSNLVDWVLRQYPPTPCISREAINSDQIDNFKINAGEPIIISLMGALYHPEDTFESSITLDSHQLHRNLAFGYGQRICGGKQYATFELLHLATEFLRHMNMELTRNTPITFNWNSQLNQLGGHPVRLSKINTSENRSEPKSGVVI